MSKRVTCGKMYGRFISNDFTIRLWERDSIDRGREICEKEPGNLGRENSGRGRLKTTKNTAPYVIVILKLRRLRGMANRLQRKR